MKIIALPGFKSFLLSSSFLLLGLLIMVALGYALNAIAPETSLTISPSIAAQFLVPHALYPKSHDRFMFLSLIMSCFSALGLLVFFWSIKNRPSIHYPSVFAFCVLMIIGLMFVIKIPPELPSVFSIDHLNVLLKVALFSGIIAGLSVINLINIKSSWFLAVFMLLIMIFTMVTRIFGESLISNEAAYIVSHLEAVIYSIIHIAGGGTCMADAIAQYGCYGEFLAPLFKIMGRSILAITVIFAILQSIAMLSITFFASKMIRSKVLLVSAIVGTIIFLNFLLTLGASDPYFQYKPLRLLFPALSLLLVLGLQRAYTKSNLFYSGLFSGLAMAWNLDTGIVVFASLLFFTLLLSFPRQTSISLNSLKHSLKQCLYFLAGTFLFLTLFFFYLEYKSNWAVDLKAAITYQQAFYLSGFAMLPIPSFPDLWTIPALLIAIMVMVSMLHIATKFEKRDPNIERAFYLAILAIGLMLYYSGRAHFFVLTLVVWPVVLIFFFLADYAIATSKKMVNFLVLIASVFFVSAPIVVYYPMWSGAIAYVTKGYDPGYAITQENIAFLKSLMSPGERVAILAANQTTYHIATKTWPALKGPSLAELLLVNDLDNLNREIAEHGPKKLIINSTAPLLVFSPTMLKLNEHYTLTKRGPGNRLLYYTRVKV